MSLSKSELLAVRFGATLEQVAALHKKNAAGLATMHKKAAASSKKVNGYTAAQLAKFTQDSELRAEWTEMLAQNEQLRNMNKERPTADMVYFDHGSNNLRTLLAALDKPKAVGPLFSVKLASVGNPDFGQYHREGVASPTILVESDSIAALVKVYQAYVSIYELGGGNIPRGCGDIYRDNVLVARISYNGRVWTTEEYPKCKEIDPSTGNIKAA